MFGYDLGFIPTLIFFILLVLIPSIKIIKEYERAVIFRLGRLLAVPKGPKGPGIIIVIPFIDKFVRVNLRLVALDVPPQDIITKDNVSVKVNAVVYFRVVEPNKAITEVDDFLYATSQLSQTTLRSILGNSELDDLLSNREHINHELQTVLDTRTDPWGIKVSAVEVKHVDLPQEMQRAMAKQAEAEREKRAKIIAADAEFQAATKLSEASEMLSKNPISIQLRYLQTLNQMSNEKTMHTVIPLPMDFLKPFVKLMEK